MRRLVGLVFFLFYAFSRLCFTIRTLEEQLARFITPENAAFGFRFAAKSDALPSRPTGVF